MLLAVIVGVVIGVLTGLMLLVTLAFCRRRYKLLFCPRERREVPW